MLGSWRIFRCDACDGHTRNLPLLFNRTNLFKDIFHEVIALESYWELHGLAIEDDLDTRPAHASSHLHGAQDFGYEVSDGKGLNSHHDSAC